MSGRSHSASRAVTRWIVARISDVRTARRSTIAADSVSGRKPSSRDHSPTYGRQGRLRLHPHEMLDGVQRGHPVPLEQHLAREQGAIERSWPEHRRR